MKFIWEEIFVNDNGLKVSTYRAKAIGGWLIMNNSGDSSRIAQGLVFIPDPSHQWSIEDEKSRDNKLDLLFTVIEDLDILVRTMRVLQNECIKYIGDLICNIAWHRPNPNGEIVFCSKLLKTPNFGKKSYRDLLSALKILSFTEYYECQQYWDERSKHVSPN